MQVVVDGLLTAYSRAGAGKTVVLLHGWGDQAAGLQGLQRQLASHYDVISVDLPGFGGTAAPEGVWGLTDYATFVAHFLAKLHIDDVWAIAGHSNGGAIAIRGLAGDILHAERLVLIASAGIRSVYKGRNRVLRMLAKTGKFFSAPLPTPLKKQLRKKAYAAIGSDMFVAEHLQETFKKVVGDDVQADAARLQQPTLLVWGEDDTAAPFWYAAQFRELIPSASIVSFAGAGHFVHLDKPTQTAAAITDFLALAQ